MTFGQVRSVVTLLPCNAAVDLIVGLEAETPLKDAVETALKIARQYFEKAVDAYRRAAAARPEDRRLDDRIQSLQSLIYDCIKRAQI